MAKLLDTYEPAALLARASEFRAAGYSAACFYYFRTSLFKERMTLPVARALCAWGFFLVAVWENGQPTSHAYFTPAQGGRDASGALLRARALGQPLGSPIYFAIDYDAAPEDMAAIAAYFAAIQPVLRAAGYEAAGYGSGAALAHLHSLGLVTWTWLAQSTGWAGWAAFRAQANIVQGLEHSVFGLDVDEDESSPRGGGGWKV